MRPDDRGTELHPSRPQRPRPRACSRRTASSPASRSSCPAVSSWSATRSSPAATTATFAPPGHVTSSRTAAPEPSSKSTRPDEVVVAFRREGTIRIPHDYLAAGHLEHGYARTTYGVQGATHDVARYHPTDVQLVRRGLRRDHPARESGPYLHRRRHGLPLDGDLTHAPDEPQAVGVHEVTQALGRRRSGHMAADASPDLDAVAQTLVGASLAQLTARRRQLNELIRQAPADTSAPIQRTRQTIVSIRIRQQAWNESRRANEKETADRAHSGGGNWPAWLRTSPPH